MLTEAGACVTFCSYFEAVDTESTWMLTSSSRLNSVPSGGESSLSSCAGTELTKPANATANMKRLGTGLNILLIIAAAVRRRIHMPAFVGRIRLTSATALFKQALGKQANDTSGLTIRIKPGVGGTARFRVGARSLEFSTSIWLEFVDRKSV